jgi:Tol biopolymer transport system component
MAFVSDYRLVAIGADGKRRRRLSRKGEYVVTAAWSPKSGTIAYIAEKPTGYGGLAKNLHLETVRADGKHVRALTHVSDGVLTWGGPYGRETASAFSSRAAEQ